MVNIGQNRAHPPSDLRLGFACHWNDSRERTWSGTPWALMTELKARADLVDLGAVLSRPLRLALKGAHARRLGSSWTSSWRQGRWTEHGIALKLQRAARHARPDVVLQIQDLAKFDAPSLVLQDLSYALLLERFGPDGIPHFRTLGKRRVEQLRRRQDAIYEGASRLLPMSRWMAKSLAEHGVSPDRIDVINPGINTPIKLDAKVPERRAGRCQRLLLVGRDFDTKGGDQVLAAFRLLREQMGAGISITIAGPAVWPGRGPVPDGVSFVGPQTTQQVGHLMDTHDLFVMPSRFEGFGIAFAEALVRGLPCVGRNDCAMPEIIDRVSGGRLIQSDAPEELASTIMEALADDNLYLACAEAAPGRRQHFTWSRAADQIMQSAGRAAGDRSAG